MLQNILLPVPCAPWTSPPHAHHWFAVSTSCATAPLIRHSIWNYDWCSFLCQTDSGGSANWFLPSSWFRQNWIVYLYISHLCFSCPVRWSRHPICSGHGTMLLPYMYKSLTGSVSKLWSLQESSWQLTEASTHAGIREEGVAHWSIPVLKVIDPGSLRLVGLFTVLWRFILYYMSTR